MQFSVDFDQNLIKTSSISCLRDLKIKGLFETNRFEHTFLCDQVGKSSIKNSIFLRYFEPFKWKISELYVKITWPLTFDKPWTNILMRTLKKKIPKNILDKHIIYIREYLICITLSPHRQKREEKAAHPRAMLSFKICKFYDM